MRDGGTPWRVVITGMGVVSAIGTGWPAFQEALRAGTSGVTEVRGFDTSTYPVHIGGEIHDFVPTDHMRASTAARCGRASQLAIAATRLALADAGLSPTDAPTREADLLIGTTMGECGVQDEIVEDWCREGEGFVRPALVPEFHDGCLPVNVAEELQLAGERLVIPTACAAGNYCIGLAADRLRSNRSGPITLAGGCDAFSRIAYVGFARMRSLAPDCCRPFDRDRAGIVIGEGAGMLVLEEREHARARGARIHAEILGHALTCDAHHMTIPEEDGVTRLMTLALQRSHVSPAEVDAVSAHGTGTRQNDRVEAAALYRVFGPGAAHLPIFSIKSMLGHTMGAASALEAVACARGLAEGVLPPTINFEHPDPECPVDCVPNQARPLAARVMLNNAFAFGANNAAVVLAAHQES